MRGVWGAGVLLGGLLTVVGCSGSGALPEAATSAPTEPRSTQAPTPTIGPLKTDPVTFSVECSYEDPSLYDPTDVNSSTLDSFVQEDFASYEAAWAAGKPWEVCEGEATGGTDYTSEQIAAARTAGYDRVEEVETLYGLCAETAGYYVTDGPGNAAQQAEVAGMLMICPDFPEAKRLLTASKEAQKVHKERAEGLRFWGAGVYQVGKDIKSGTFRATDVDGCYWERQDSSGKTIENDYVVAAKQVEIAVKPTDFAVVIDGGCGEWVHVK